MPGPMQAVFLRILGQPNPAQQTGKQNAPDLWFQYRQGGKQLAKVGAIARQQSLKTHGESTDQDIGNRTSGNDAFICGGASTRSVLFNKPSIVSSWIFG
jgi:hypothetical protein